MPAIHAGALLLLSRISIALFPVAFSLSNVAIAFSLRERTPHSGDKVSQRAIISCRLRPLAKGFVGMSNSKTTRREVHCILEPYGSACVALP